MNYEKHRNFKYNEKYFDLKNIEGVLCDFLPDYYDFDFVHVAGSKGKGTTCKIVADYLSDLGSFGNVGLFISPHILKINERISVNGKDIFDKDFEKLLDDLRKFLKKRGGKSLTFFEELFVVALKYFHEKKCKYVVLEVGLGGRLDATNVVLPKVCGLALVEKEHTDVLGKTLRKILNEKLGIKKMGVPFIVGRQQKNIEKLLREKFKKDENVFFADDFVEIVDPNFALAYGLLKTLLGRVDDEKFLKICSDFKMVGRFDVRKILKNICVFDIAHTPKSIENLVKNLKERFSAKKFFFVVSLMKDKEILPILRQISNVASGVIFTNANEERGEKSEKLKKIFDEILSKKKVNKLTKKKVFVKENSVSCFNFALKNSKKEDVVVVTGSSFLVSKILNRKR